MIEITTGGAGGGILRPTPTSRGNALKPQVGIAPQYQGSVDRLKVVATEVHRDRKTRGRKTDRKYIEGTDELWQISPDGSLFYKRQRQEPGGNRVPMIDLGPAAKSVPVLKAYDDGSDIWFVDELVAWHFVKKTKIELQRFTHTVHLDGDPGNCAANNLKTMIDTEWWEQNTSFQWVELWATDASTAKLVKMGEAARFGGIRGETWPRDLRDRGDVKEKRDLSGGINTLPGWANVLPWSVQDRIKTDQEKACA